MSPNIENGAGLEAVLYEERDHWRGGARTVSQTRTLDGPGLQDIPVEANAVYCLQLRRSTRPST